MTKTKRMNLKKRKHKCPTCECNRAQEMKLFEREVIKPMEKALKDNPIILAPVDQDFEEPIFEEPIDEDCF